MTNHSNRTLARLAPLAAAAALLATACGSSTTTSQADAQLPQAATAADDVALDVPAPAATTPTEAVVTAPPVTQPATTDPSTDASTDEAETPDTTAPAPEPEPDPGPDPAPDPTDTVTAEPPVSCGDFGPIPPIPDSMPTLLFDTDGDGNEDDEVTAYGDIDGWLLRVVENGVTSEALMTGIPGYANIANSYKVDGRDYIEVHDQELGTIFTLATVDGCAELLHIGPGHEEVIDLVPWTPDPDPALIPLLPSDLTIYVPPCGFHAAIPGGASIASNITVDVAADGTADDQIVTYLDGGWTMRATVNGITSEVSINGVGPGATRALGVADVGALTAGNEIIATVGAGAYTTQIGVFGIDSNGCLFHFLDSSGTELAMSSGASIGFGDRFSCGPGYIAGNSWSNQFDGTYDMGGAAYIESTLGQFTYMPASDDYSEGLSFDQLPTDLFDCNGLSL